MPATITRGKSFGLTELVAAGSLNQLVTAAGITGLSSADLGTFAQIYSNGSAPSTAAVGSISAQYEGVNDSASISLAEFKYVLSGPTGQVALFSPYGLETRRIKHADGGTLSAGLIQLIKSSTAAPASLAGTYTYSTGTPQHHFIGGLQSTALSGTYGRLIMRGIIGANIVDAGGAPVRHYAYLLNAATGQFQHSAGVTNTNKVLGLSLDNRRSGDAVIPFFLFGAPIWRSA